MELPAIDAIAGKARELDGEAGSRLDFEVYWSWANQTIDAAEKLGYRLVKAEGAGIQVSGSLAELGEGAA